MLRRFFSCSRRRALRERAADRAGRHDHARLATLAPAASPWGKVFKAWQKGVKDQQQRRGRARVLLREPAGRRGRDGRQECARASSTAPRSLPPGSPDLQERPRPPDAGALPRLERPRQRAQHDAPELDAAFEKEGFIIGGWGDVGIAHMMTKGFEVHSPPT